MTEIDKLTNAATDKYSRAEIALAAGEIAHVAALLMEVKQRGWDIEFKPEGREWGAMAPEKAAFFSYVVPDDFGAGTVSAFDESKRTLKLTGVELHSEAVDRVREFFGWSKPVVVAARR